MGDMVETFRAWDKAKKEKRLKNLEISTSRLKELGVSFEKKNGGVHLIVSHNNYVVDFWPSTGKFKFRNKSNYGRGLLSLIKQLGIK